MKSIISFLTFVLEGLAKIVMFLLSALGLWIPAIYTLAFVIVCAVAGIPFNDALGVFYLGLCLSCLLALWVAVAQVLKARKKNDAKKREQTENIAKIELKEQPLNTAPQYNPQGQAPQYGQPYPPQYAQPYQGANQPVPPQYNQPYSPQYGQPYQGQQPYQYPPQQGGYNGYNGQNPFAGMGNANGGFQGYVNPDNAYSDQEVYRGAAPQQTAPIPHRETPVVYRSRTEPNLIIHEYSDRLVYFRKTESGFEPDGTEFKQSSGQ